MKKTLLSFTIAAAAVFSLAAKELVYNHELKAEGRSFPSGWMPLTRSGAQVLYFHDGGPDNKPFFRLTSRKAPSLLHQTNLKLVKGEKYILGAWFRTRNVKNKKSRCKHS